MKLSLCLSFPSFAGSVLASHHASQSASSTARNSITPSYSIFSYTEMTSDRYPTPLPSPLSFPTPFGPPFKEASTLLPTSVTYTTYNLRPTSGAILAGKFGQKSYAALWTSLSYTDAPPFTTTASPTPVPCAELVYPPALPFRVAAEENMTLPCDFIWGVAGSAWQIEGALQLGGRGPSVLDSVGAIGSARGGNDSNVANMNYFLYKQDIARLAAMGIPYYSFSISWSRIVPFGIAGSPLNIEALEHYEDVISTCLQHGIKPIVTLFHFDLPISVDIDDPEFATHFLYYAKAVMARYADRVQIWVTVNELNMGMGLLFKTYNAITWVLKAHAQVYDWYKTELKGTGRITMKFGNLLAVPLDPSKTSHVAAAHRYQDFLMAIIGNPLFLGKQYPSEVLNTPHVNLKALTADEISSIHGRADFFAVDPYVAQFASPVEEMEACMHNSSNPLWPTCTVLTNVQANGWLMGDGSMAYPYVAPQYVRQQLSYIWNTFRPAGIMVSEFGFPVFAEAQKSLPAQQYDLERTLYYQGFLQETLKSIYLDGVRVIGTLAWSFVDNNELGSYLDKYGLQNVNRTNGHFTRTFKRSIFDFVEFFQEHIA